MTHRIINTEAERAVDYHLLKVTSKAFDNEGWIPSRFTCDGININPPLDIDDVPLHAKSMALIVEDPDAPIRPWTHWIVWNIPLTHHIKENEVHGIEGLNDFGQHPYAGPCPPAGTHHYFFKVYALDTVFDIGPNTRKTELEKEISGHIIAFGELEGLYKKNK